jgi:hypothetical protein
VLARERRGWQTEIALSVNWDFRSGTPLIFSGKRRRNTTNQSIAGGPRLLYVICTTNDMMDQLCSPRPSYFGQIRVRWRRPERACWLALFFFKQPYISLNNLFREITYMMTIRDKHVCQANLHKKKSTRSKIKISPLKKLVPRRTVVHQQVFKNFWKFQRLFARKK